MIYKELGNERWYPEVGRAPPPDLHSVRGRTDTVNRKYKPRSPR